MQGKKILKFIRNADKPITHFLVKRGWYFRLQRKKRSGMNFNKLEGATKKEIKEYWKYYGKNISTDWCSYFSWGNGIVDKKYIPESLYYGEILKKLNNQRMGVGLSDKNIYDLLFDTKQPRTIIRKANGVLLDKDYSPLMLEDAYELCNNEKNIILKPANGTYGGSGIEFWTVDDGIESLKNKLNSHKDFIVQEVVKQHPFLSDIHPQSLNTMRIVTLLVDESSVHLSTILRMGRNNNKVDNFSAGGLICAVDKKGFLYEKAVQGDQSVITEHPSGFVFKNKQIPHYERIIEDAKRMHYKIPYFKMISWDYSLSPEGEPIMIEGNYPAGQIDLHQLNIGPIFGEYTDRVLEHVYKGKDL